MKKSLFYIVLLLLCTFHFELQAQTVNEPQNNSADWSKPYEPFRIAGNLYYVGTYDLASYLVVTDKGNILVNTGLANSRQQIKKNIERLGFKYRDINTLPTRRYDTWCNGSHKKKPAHSFGWMRRSAGRSGGATDYELSFVGVSFAPLAG